MNTILRLSLELYRGLLHLYPANLQRRFGSEMVDVFEQQLLEASDQQEQQASAASGAAVWLKLPPARPFRHSPKRPSSRPPPSSRPSPCSWSSSGPVVSPDHAANLSAQKLSL